eukprot:3197308-Rhodomonas_salina.1
MTLIRNDVAFSTTLVHLSDLLPDADHLLLPKTAGRLLVLKSKPTGAHGELWHVNLYAPTNSASPTHRNAFYTVWEAALSAARER